MKFLLCACVVLLSACSSRSTYQRQAERKHVETPQRMQAELKPGMTVSEIRERGFELTNCRGNPERPTSCELFTESRSNGLGLVAAFATRLALAGTDTNSDPSASKTHSLGKETHVALYFEDGKLKQLAHDYQYVAQ